MLMTLMRVTKIFIYAILIVVPAWFGLLPALVQAHASLHPYYMAVDGIDRGRCLSPLHPCRTFAYTLAQTIGKEETIRVAAGAYRVTASELQAIVGGLVWVEGGYRRADLFARQDGVANPTYLLGVAARYQAQLATQGFTLYKDGTNAATAPGGVTIAAQPAAAAATCVNGLAATYPCDKIDLLGHLPLAALRSNPTAANDVWGHVDLNDGREYALVGLRNGTAIVDVTIPTAPVEVTTIAGANTAWRDIKSYQFFDQATDRWRSYAYVTSEAAGQGMQILDLSQLPLTVNLAATYHGISRAHNVYLGEVDYRTGVARGGTPQLYLLGSDLDRGAFRILDLTVPTAPVPLSTPSATMEYVHDATTFVISDTRTAACAPGHNPCTLLLDYNENTVDLWDVTAGSAPYRISTTPYAGARYTHSGWWSADKRYAYIQDEQDEYRLGHNTRLWVMDLTNLLTPTVQIAWTGPTRAIDHNGYTKGNHYFISNYERGLTVLDVTQPTTATDIGFFDTYPAGDEARFNGAWGVYPYLPSGNLLVSDIQSGLFVLRLASAAPTATATATAPLPPTATPTLAMPTMATPTATITALATATPTVTPQPALTPAPTATPTTTKAATVTPVVAPTASPTPNATAPATGNGNLYTFFLPLVTR